MWRIMKAIRTIGQGGFGIVDLLQDENGNSFARKTFKFNQANSFSTEYVENIKKRFIREANVQAAIDHQNIVPVLQKDIANDPPFYIMPLADSSLADDIVKNKDLAGKGISAIMDILSGLEKLHSIGIIHRDLKPANVLNMKGSYAISDFGLMSIKDTKISALTQTGMRMGSDYYTAPEIVADLRLASVQSDIYSVGCILHDMYGATTRIPCNEINDSGHFSDVILGCTRRDPTRRFRSVTQLRDAIVAHGPSSNISVNVEKQVKDYIDLLLSNANIDLNIWDKIIDKLESLGPSNDSKELLKITSLSRIEELIKVSPKSAARFGSIYSNWVKGGTFDFSNCDGVANRLEAFLAVDDISCQSDTLLALLLLGTSHNRWYVERKFFEHCSSKISENVAGRLSMEIRILGAEACSAIAHLENSIHISRQKFHPLLVSTLNLICKC